MRSQKEAERAVAVRRSHDRPLALLFDLDDTLCDYAPARDLRLRTAFLLNGNGRPVARPDIDLEEMIAASLRRHPHGAEHFPELFAEFGIDRRAAERAQEWYRANRFYGLSLFDDVRPVLSTLKANSAAGSGRERSIGLITNGPTEVQRQKVELLGIGDLVDFVIISEEFGVAKPDPAIFAEALRRADATANRSLFVGDSPEFDIAGARASGIAPVWMNRYGRVWDADGAEAPREARSLHDLLPLI